MRITHYTYLRLLPLLLCLFSLQFIPLSAHARLTGEAELGYVKYDATVDGAKVIDANSFQQRYSLLYSNSLAFAGGRVGGANYSLGYEWGSFDTTVKSSLPGVGQSVSQNRGHFLFNGEVLIDPKELPLTFFAYSRDMNRMQFQDDLWQIGSFTSNGFVGDIVRPNMPSNIVDGQRIYSGATLLLGVRNGMTNGYNEIFRLFPMLMLDYKDEIIHDPKSFTPMDTRLSRFAFVSLNKKDNWFHFRSTRYSDYINPDNDWKEKAFQIGTIDQNLQRKWVDFTNWIKLSVDGGWTKRDAANPIYTTERYDINLFAIATRKTWEARNFNTFSRWTEGKILHYDANVPVYVTGTWGADTDWRFRVSDREQKLMSTSGVWESTSDVLSSLQVTTFKRSPFTLTPSASVEYYDTTTTGKTLALEGAVETASTRRFSSRYELFGRYDIKYFTAERSGVASSTYLTQDIDGRIAYIPSSKWRFQLEQRFQMGSGTNPGINGAVITVNNDFNTITDSNKYIQRDGLTINDYTRSVSSATVNWSPLARLSISLSASEDVLMASGQPASYITNLSNTVSYSVADLSVHVNNRYQIQNSNQGTNNDLNSSALVSYKPNRNMDGSLNFIYERQTIDSDSSTYIDLTQKFNYNFYRVNGINRKILELNEQIDYTKNSNQRTSSPLLISGLMSGLVSTTASSTVTRISLGARYYPLQRLYLAATSQYYLLEPGAIKGQIYTGSIGFTANKLQVSLDYSYGTQQNSVKRVEQRFAANMKKFF
ncbi:hypothetical protein [Geomobilimonas luticola]|uniref:Uncharacterized protein n=1 Tax=Geomobilimonas luticola TaxID=1114878 RepID=A0ABS5SGY7_9BACT|nr:hypothetical protein [Geomobilimonas luticola]MBT0653774.1 hypothetical protein [Geomobilimonas luticola]